MNPAIVFAFVIVGLFFIFELIIDYVETRQIHQAELMPTLSLSEEKSR